MVENEELGAEKPLKPYELPSMLLSRTVSITRRLISQKLQGEGGQGGDASPPAPALSPKREAAHGSGRVGFAAAVSEEGHGHAHVHEADRRGHPVDRSRSPQASEVD